VIESRGLRREYGGLVAVDDVTVSFPKGAVVALVGPNGAGKSTWMRMVAGLLEPTRGTALVGGVDVVREPQRAHRLLAFLPDFFGLYDDLKVREMLEHAGRAYGLTERARRERSAYVLDRVKLLDKQDDFVAHLSRGMRQRLAVAKSLLHDPPVVLLDEPASGLDPEARHDFQELMREIARDGKTLVISSHILTELEEYCTHVAMMHKGKVVAAGAIAAVRRDLTAVRKVRVEIADGLAKAREVFAKAETAKGVEIVAAETGAAAGSAVFALDGGDRDLAELMKTLLVSGVVVTAFGPADGSIQDAYLSLMRGRGE
jgi:ABC-2 type transport system ATP-binding protein